MGMNVTTDRQDGSIYATHFVQAKLSLALVRQLVADGN